MTRFLVLEPAKSLASPGYATGWHAHIISQTLPLSGHHAACAVEPRFLVEMLTSSAPCLTWWALQVDQNPCFGAPRLWWKVTVANRYAPGSEWSGPRWRQSATQSRCCMVHRAKSRALPASTSTLIPDPRPWSLHYAPAVATTQSQESSARLWSSVSSPVYRAMPLLGLAREPDTRWRPAAASTITPLGIFPWRLCVPCLLH